MGTIKQNFGNQLTVTVDHIGLVNKWDVSVRGHSGLRVATGRSRNLDRAIRKALRVAAGKEATFMTVEQYRQQQIDQQVRESEKTITQLINHLEAHCLEVACDLEDPIAEEPAGEITLNIPGRGILHFPADLCPQGRDARAEFVKTIMAAMATTPAETLTDVFRKQAGAWGDSIETRLGDLDERVAALETKRPTKQVDK